MISHIRHYHHPCFISKKGVLQTAVSDIWLHHDTDHHHYHHPHHDITDHLRIGGCGKSLWKGAVDGRYCRDRPGFYDFYIFILQRLFSFIIFSFSFSYCKNCPSFMTFFYFHIADTIILTALTFLPPAQFHHTGCFFYWSALKMIKCQTPSKFWHLELFLMGFTM